MYVGQNDKLRSLSQTLEHRLTSISGAPLTNSRLWGSSPLVRQSTDIDLRLRLRRGGTSGPTEKKENSRGRGAGGGWVGT